MSTFVDQVLRCNGGVELARERIVESEAWRRLESRKRLPEIDFGLSGSRRYQTTEAEGGSGESRYALEGEIRWELDYAGRLRQLEEAKEYELEGTRWQARSVELMYSEAAVYAWIEYGMSMEYLEQVEELLRNAERQSKVMAGQFGYGRASRLDVMEQRNAQRELESLFVEASERLALAQIGVERFCEEGVSHGFEDGLVMPERQEVVGTVTLEALVAYQPKLQVKLAKVAQVDAELGAVLRERFPRVVLELIGESGADGVGRLLEDRAVSLIGGMVWELYRGGQRRAKTDVYQSQLKQALIDFETSAYEAWKDVERLVVRSESLDTRYQLVEEARASARRQAAEARLRFLNGQEGYGRVAESERQLRESELAYLGVKQELFEVNAMLFAATGGGVVE